MEAAKACAPLKNRSVAESFRSEALQRDILPRQQDEFGGN
jgi:hypothetical protein